jgi:uncharacterized membrane protein
MTAQDPVAPEALPNLLAVSIRGREVIAVRLSVTSLAVVGLGMLLGASAYESIVMAPNFAARVPESLQHIRGFFITTNPGTFFRVLAPATQILLLSAVVLNWRLQRARWFLVGALVALAVADVITFTFHYPRNALLFERPLDQVPLSQLLEAARQWGPGNHVRVALLATAFLSALRGLMTSAERGRLTAAAADERLK